MVSQKAAPPLSGEDLEMLRGIPWGKKRRSSDAAPLVGGWVHLSLWGSEAQGA